MRDQFIFYLRDLYEFSGVRLWVSAALVGCGAVLEAFGIVALVPLFSFVVGGDGEWGSVDVDGVFRLVGIESAFAKALMLTALFVALIALRALLLYYRDVYLKQLALEYVDKWRRVVLGAIREAPWKAIVAQRRADLEHTVLSDVSRLSVGNDRLLRGGATIAIMIAQLAVLATLSPAMLVFVIVLMAVFGLLGMPLLRRSERRGIEMTGRGRGLHRTLTNLLTGQKLARLHNAQEAFNRQMTQAAQAMRENQIEFTRIQSSTQGILQVVSAAAVAATLLFGYFAMALSLPVLLVVVVIVVRIAGAGQQLLQTAQSTANMLPALAAIRATIASLSDSGTDGFDDASGDEPRARREAPASLALEDIWFRHGKDAWTIEAMTMRAQPGEFVALVGQSGAGKTTLLDIATGLLPPARGTVRVDGQVLQSPADWRHWRDEIAYLPQDPFLFDASIAENLRWFVSDIGEAALTDAMRIADIADKITALPDGLDTRVGERGQLLSGGERQRLCFARALLARPRLLILDEALSAVEERRADRIMRLLAQWPHRPTVIFVTHRSQGLAFADQVVEMTVKGREG